MILKANLLSISSILFILSFNAFPQSINSPLHHDKQKHIIVGAGIGLATLVFTKEKTDLQRILIGGGVATGTAFTYELYQGITGSGSVEALDVIYTGLGGMIGASIVLIFKKRKHDKRTSNRSRRH